MKRRLLFVLLCVFSVISVTNAQDSTDEASPFLQLLELLPGRTNGDLYFNDYAAIEQAYAPATRPANWAEFDALSADTAAEMFPIDVWWRVFTNISSPLSQYFGAGDEMPAAMGIEFFDIDRSLLDLAPPRTITVLQGDFDLPSIRAALTEREFTQQPLNSNLEDIEIWCGAVGCENSQQTNPGAINRADLFGGDLGRQWGRIIAPNIMIGANFFEDLQAVEDTLSGESASHTDNNRLRAAVQAVSGQGVLLQALIPSTENLLAFFNFQFMLDPRMTRDQFAAVIDAMLEDYETLPAFDFMMLADIASDTEQIGEVVLVYSSEEEAEQAIPVLLDRIENYMSIRYRRAFSQILADRRVEVSADTVNIDNWSVVRLKFATPKAAPEEVVQFIITLSPDELPDVTAPGLVYRMLLDAYNARDLGWLSLVTRSELEALASDS